VTKKTLGGIVFYKYLLSSLCLFYERVALQVKTKARKYSIIHIFPWSICPI